MAVLMRVWLVSACSLLLPGCMFLVDFEELKQGDDSADAGSLTPGPAEPEPSPGNGGSGGTANPGGGAPSGGAGGSDGAPCTLDEECADEDPCTVDSCDGGRCRRAPMECPAGDECVEFTCVDGQCVETRLAFVADDFESEVAGDEVHRTTLLAGEGRFFHSVYGVFNGVSDLRLGGFDQSGSTLLRPQSLASGLSGESYEVASPGGLVIDGEGNLNVYVAVRDASLDGTPQYGEVLRIEFDQSLSLASSTAKKQGTAASYRFLSERIGPVASVVPGSEPFVAWPGTLLGATITDGIFFQVGDDVVSITDPSPNFLAVPNPISALAAAHTDSVPAVVWMTDVPGGGVEVFAGTAAGQTAPLAQCHVDASSTGHGLHAGLTVGDLWTVSWSEQGAGYVSENTVIECRGDACVDESGLTPGAACDEDTSRSRINDGFRHLLVETFPDPENPDALYQVILVARDSGSTASIVMLLNHAVLGGASTPLGSVTVASGPSAQAPDWPEIAILPPETVAVSWVQAAADEGAEAHFARYRICPMVQ